MGPKLEKGQRAIAFGVHPATAGFFPPLPGFRVNIYLVGRDPDAKRFSKKLLTNVVVLDADRVVPSLPSSGASIVTFAVKPNEAEILLKARDEGELCLGPPEEGSEQRVPFVRIDDLTAEMGPKLEKGQRAFAIRADLEKAAGGFVMPNRRVDILLLGRDPDGKPLSKTLLTNILVLAADNLRPSDEANGTRVPPTVTVAVKPKEAEILRKAGEEGALWLSVRPLDESLEKDKK
jgi:Flp pilus assembly protein CpaB